MNKKYLNSFIFVVLGCIMSSRAAAVDASDISKVIYENGSWKIIEISAKTRIIYRMATDSINIKDTHLTIDLLNQCKFEPLVMVKKFAKYNPLMSKGKLILQYRIPDLLENQEIVDTEMTEGDTYGFFSFKNLLADNLFISKESSRLAIWVPPSGDGRVQRSANTYFSLEGFKVVYSKAKSLCNDNK